MGLIWATKKDLCCTVHPGQTVVIREENGRLVSSCGCKVIRGPDTWGAIRPLDLDPRKLPSAHKPGAK